MDITLIVSVIGWFMAPISAYVIAKTMLNRNRILDIFEDIMDETSTNEQFKAKLFAVGAILGSGIMSGTGIQTKTGKFKWQDLAAQVIGQYAQKYLGGQQQSEQTGVLGQT